MGAFKRPNLPLCSRIALGNALLNHVRAKSLSESGPARRLTLLLNASDRRQNRLAIADVALPARFAHGGDGWGIRHPMRGAGEARLRFSSGKCRVEILNGQPSRRSWRAHIVRHRPLQVIRHAVDIGAGGIEAWRQLPPSAKSTHARAHIGQLDPFKASAIDQQIPFLHLAGVMPQQGEIAEHHQFGLNVMA